MNKSLKEEYLQLLKKNQREVDGNKFTVPSSSYYPYQWFWDSCFHSIIYSVLWEYDYAKGEILSKLENQWEDWMIPHIAYWNTEQKENLNWWTENSTSSITQPPIIAYSVERIFKETEDSKFVLEVINKLHNYYMWLKNNRSINYVLYNIHPWESWQDDFITWDSIYWLTDINPEQEHISRHKEWILEKFVDSDLHSKNFIKKRIFSAKSLLFNMVYHRNLQSMYFLCKVTNSKFWDYYEKEITNTKKYMLRDFQHDLSWLYVTKYNKNTSVNEIFTSDIFIPLYSGIISQSEAKCLVQDYLINKDMFWTKYPVPTVAINHEKFEPNRYWRGSTWININWFIVKGLRKYWFNDIADEIRNRSIELVKKSWFHEYFNPLTWEWHGPSDFSWTGLILDM